LQNQLGLSVKIYLRDDVQRPVAVVRVTFIRFPVCLEDLVRAHVLKFGLVRGDFIRQSLSHSDVIAGPNVELDPASVGYISMCDALTGYWQIGIEDQPRWSWITLTYPQRLQRRL